MGCVRHKPRLLTVCLLHPVQHAVDGILQSRKRRIPRVQPCARRNRAKPPDSAFKRLNVHSLSVAVSRPCGLCSLVFSRRPRRAVPAALRQSLRGLCERIERSKLPSDPDTVQKVAQEKQQRLRSRRAEQQRRKHLKICRCICGRGRAPRRFHHIIHTPSGVGPHQRKTPLDRLGKIDQACFPVEICAVPLITPAGHGQKQAERIDKHHDRQQLRECAPADAARGGRSFFAVRIAAFLSARPYSAAPLCVHSASRRT